MALFFSIINVSSNDILVYKINIISIKAETIIYVAVTPNKLTNNLVTLTPTTPPPIPSTPN